MDRIELDRLAAALDLAPGGSDALDRRLLVALGWRPAPVADGVCWLSWGQDPGGGEVWAGTEPRPTSRVDDARRLHGEAFPDLPPPPGDALDVCRALVARLLSRG